jgi:aspartate 1-decarboxylase
MLLRLLHAKIHRAVVTQADVDYEGSITIDSALLRAAQLREYEAVQVWNVTNGERFETYTLAGESGSGVICVNGAAAHLVAPGDLVIIAAFRTYTAEEAADHRPVLVFVDNRNRLREIRAEIPGPARPAKFADLAV